MTTKILIGGGELLKLLADHPEIEIELTKQASMQVAEVFRRKVEPAAIVDGMVARINGELASKYRMPESVLAVIRSIVTERVVAILDEKAERLVTDALNKAMKRYTGVLEDRLSSKIDEMVLEAVTKTIKAAARLGGKS